MRRLNWRQSAPLVSGISQWHHRHQALVVQDCKEGVEDELGAAAGSSQRRTTVLSVERAVLSVERAVLSSRTTFYAENGF